jgi:cytoplasmic tRNA 2-thiolation protein 1
LDYFSTECIYSPEAFRGSARALIKNLERVRPSAILDIVRSGEDMARLVPGYEDKCKGECRVVHTATAAEEEEGGCGSTTGRTGGGEMARMEKMLVQTEKAGVECLETEVTLPKATAPSVSSDGSVKLPLRQKKEKQQASFPRKQPPKQTMGECERCGYLSSQKICKACVLLEGLNKNKAKVSVEEIPSAPTAQEANIAVA